MVKPRASDTLAYIGTLDDVVERFPWKGFEVGLRRPDFLLETIVEHVLFGAPMLFNDGYLVNHPEARRDLMKGDKSLIATLVRKGFIKILTRTDDLQLHEMPIRMRRNVASMAALVDSADWPVLRWRLEEISAALRPDYNVYRWPTVATANGRQLLDMGDGFRLLLDNVRSSVSKKGFSSLGFEFSDETKVRHLLDSVIGRLEADTLGARSFYESAARASVADLSPVVATRSLNEMMGLANEAYHFNFGLNLNHELKDRGIAVVTETRMSRAFDDLLAVDEAVVELQGTIPLIARPKFPISAEPRILAEVSDPASDIGRAKELFQQRMRNFVGGRHSIEEAQAFSAIYERALEDHFTTSVARKRDRHAITIGLNLAQSVIGASLVSGPVGSAIGFGLGLLSSYVGESQLYRTASRLRRRAVMTDAAPISPNVQRAMLSVLRFDDSAASEIARAVKPL